MDRSKTNEREKTTNKGRRERQSLADISQEVISQILHLFPFYSSSSSPRVPFSPFSSSLLFRAKSTSSVQQLKKQQNIPSQSLCPAVINDNANVQIMDRIRRVASNLSLTAKGQRERRQNLALFWRKGEAKKATNEEQKERTKEEGALSKLCKMSVDTMAITALPLDCWLKERLKNWVQLSGHEGTIVPASNHTLWKKQPRGNRAEAHAYEQIMRDSELRGITPKFYKEIAHNNETFIEIQDLLAQFPNTKRRAIMDVKIGTRTFMESEVSNDTKRVDLYQKMVTLAPDEPTEKERAEGKVTKLRYMQFRERESSSASLGFRIEAAQLPGRKLQKNFKKVKSRQKVQQTLEEFFGGSACHFRPQLNDRLRQIRKAVERSEFFQTHEVVGSSLLIIYDEKRIGAWLIDFAKCTRTEEGQTLTHRTPWKLGNHEDGWLTGLDNLIGVLGQKREER
ncbi:hypothetical protein niasHT_015841 [Heterodera trifolii]|uniref:Kinase n=1 Tax=Heterodera trifolii TaxID=157864 RepID=A0ABD2L521_9BILA